MMMIPLTWIIARGRRARRDKIERNFAQLERRSAGSLLRVATMLAANSQTSMDPTNFCLLVKSGF